MRKQLRDWILGNKAELFFLVGILLVGAFVRLYRIPEYMTFLGDEGRDAIVVRRLLVDFDPILIGPGTSIGNMYLGPLYYYFMAPFLLLANFSPVGPAIAIALLGLVTIWFVWFVTREWFGDNKRNIHFGSLAAAFLYAISPVVIIYSRSSWNPNIMPFFALLVIYSVWRVWQKEQYKWLLVLGVSLAFVLQSHYIALLLLPVAGFFWLTTALKVKNTKSTFVKYSLLSAVVFLVLMSPLVIFDARHNWQNFSAIKLFFTERQTTVSARPWTSLPKMLPIWQNDFVTRIMAGTDSSWGGSIAFGLVGLIVVFLMHYMRDIKRLVFRGDAKKSFTAPFLLLFVWLFVAILGLGLYKQHVYDHYFGFVFAAPYILFGGFVEKVWGKNKVVKIIIVLLVLGIASVNIKANPLQYPPNRQMQRAIDVTDRIIKESGQEKLNLAVLAQQNYEDGYQYFLEKENAKFVEIDPQRSETVAPQLFVVCELPKEKCDPTHSPKAEVANFGWSKIAGEWEVAGVTLYRLVHSDGQQ